MGIESIIKVIREEFPVLKYMVYMNSAAHGPALGRVQKSVDDWWQLATYENWAMRGPDAKTEAARMLGVDVDEITWVNRVSQSLNIVSSMMELREGDNVVVTDLGYPSNVYAFMPWRKRGVEIRRVKHRQGEITTNDFEAVIDDRTKVVSLSHIEWTSGILYDVKTITDIAHENGALVVDDGYQSQGNVHVEPKRDGIDFYTFGSQKWMCCPALAGVLYVKRENIERFEPVYRCYDRVESAYSSGAPWEKPTHDNIESWEGALGPGADKFNQGLVSHDAIWGFHASLEFFNSIGTKEIERRNRSLSSLLIEGLKEFNVKINTPEDPKWRGGLVTFTTGRHEDNQRLFNMFTKEGVKVALRYAAGVGGIRVSTHFFNTEDEVEQLLVILKRTLV